ncbi:MAG TPA: serine/threonine-protein kinase [Kofleriaceae bacterium]|nr:serine/threonine-protein kinase [Kofleriaceae bacterium]
MAEPGDLIGPYRLLARLGKGAMGDVWRARDERLDRYVAVKLLPPDLAGDPERRARMLREARAAAGVGHANVVTLYDIVTDGETDVLVMELVDGATISETLKKNGPPAPNEAIDWLIAITDALAAAHAKGILHRDVKSANVMLTKAGQVKVLDFGLAKLRDDGQPAPVVEPKPRVSKQQEVALDATMPSDLGAGTGTGSEYVTQAGSLLGTPMYMAPEQIAGGAPDERSEVFSVGVIAYELGAGKPPYAARTMDELFAQIAHEPPPPLPDRVPAALASVIGNSLAKDPEARYGSMRAFCDALAEVKRKLYAPRRWPWIAAAIALALAAAALAFFLTRPKQAAPDQPGDAYVRQALHEYDVFQGDRALASLRSALRIAPTHPRALAYTILFGGPAPDRATAAAAAEKVIAGATGKDKTLLDTAIALERRGPRAARATIAAAQDKDRELAFWAAEMAYRAGDYDAAGAEYTRLLDDPAPEFRGRIYDHDSSVLLYDDEPERALAIGKMYRDAYPAEADAIAVYATTLAAAGKIDEGLAAATDAKTLAEGEDTLAGLGKLYAWKGDLPQAIALYTQSMQRAGDSRRPIRRAALALLQWMKGDLENARATVAPCLPGGADAQIHERAACVFVAGVIDPSNAEPAAQALDALAAEADDLHPAYGRPASLAALVRARAKFFGGGCVIDTTSPVPDAATIEELEAAYAMPRDFYATYHVPFFLTWADCEAAALAAARGDRSRAAGLLAPHVRAPGRWWIAHRLAGYQATH